MPTVYAQPGGPYHRSKDCAGDQPYEFTLEKADSLGMDPCGNCVETMSVDITGYASTRVDVSKEKWESMSRNERHRWAENQIRQHGTPGGVSVIERDGERLEKW